MVDNGAERKLAVLRQMVALQAKVCYMNVDRTLATWTRTALSLLVFGTVVDRFAVLLMGDHPEHVGTLLAPNPASSVGGIALVALGILIATAAAVRHQAYRARWQRVYGEDDDFGPWLAFWFAVMVVLSGIALLAVLLVCVR